MKRKLIFVLFALSLISLMASCTPVTKETHVSISCDDFSQHPLGNRNEFTIGVGDKVYIDLCSNPTTGYKWEYTMTGDSAVTEADYAYKAPDSTMVGASGTESWTFKGTEKGEAIIMMSYSQPWDGGTKNSWEYQLTITVK